VREHRDGKNVKNVVNQADLNTEKRLYANLLSLFIPNFLENIKECREKYDSRICIVVY
jgi:hypothetical protein